jgi:hypothetical protein
VEIQLSIDDGNSWSSVTGSTDDDGFYLWVVPDSTTSLGRIRVTGTDAFGNQGSDISDGVFAINGANVPGDVNGDGLVNVSDILVIVDTWGICIGICLGDLNSDGLVNVVDLLIVIDSW